MEMKTAKSPISWADAAVMEFSESHRAVNPREQVKLESLTDLNKHLESIVESEKYDPYAVRDFPRHSTYQVQKEIALPLDEVNGVQVLPDFAVLLTGNWYSPMLADKFDGECFRGLCQLSDVDDSVSNVQIMPSRDILCIEDSMKCLLRMNVTSDGWELEQAIPSSSISAFHALPNGNLIHAGADFLHIRTKNVDGKFEIHVEPTGLDIVNSLQAIPDGRIFATGNDGLYCCVKVLQPQADGKWNAQDVIKLLTQEDIFFRAFPNGTVVAVTDSTNIKICKCDEKGVWSERTFVSDQLQITAIQLVKDDRILFLSDNEGESSISELRQKDNRWLLDQVLSDTGTIKGFHALEDGRIVTVGSMGLKIWSGSNGEFA